MGQKIKTWICKEFGNYESLELIERWLPELQDDEVQVKIVACSLNFPDLLVIENKYQYKPEGVFTPGGEASGVVEKIGAGVHHVKPGQRVFLMERWGNLAEKVIVKSERVFPLPANLDFGVGASSMYTFSTAYYALKNRGKVKPGETILITGSGGGVGLAAIQLAKVFGLKVIASAGSFEKLELAKRAGADLLINYEKDDLKEKIKIYTENQGVNLVLDTVGGELSEVFLRSLASGGRYLVVGFAAGEIPKIALNWVLLKSADIKGVFWGKWAREEPDKQAENIREIQNLFSAGKLKSIIGEEYSFEEAAIVIKNYKNQQVLGKSLIVINQDLVNLEVIPEGVHKKFSFNSKADIFKNIGTQLGESSWLQITQEMIDEFAFVTGDQQWIHCQPKIAEPRGGTIAHGFFVLSLSSMLLEEIYAIPFAQMALNYGLDKLRFIKPIPVNSKIKMTATLLAAEDAKNGGVKMKVEAKFFIENEPELVCIAELISVIY